MKRSKSVELKILADTERVKGEKAEEKAQAVMVKRHKSNTWWSQLRVYGCGRRKRRKEGEREVERCVID